MIFLLLFISQLFLFKCSYQINLITSYKFGSGNYLFYFDNGLYDYYVFGNLINTNKKINFKFCYEQSTLYVYSYSSKFQMDKASIQNTLDFFKMVYLYREYNGNEYCYSFEYKKNSNDNDYFYIAIHLSNYAPITKIPMSIDSYIEKNVKLITSYKFGSGESIKIDSYTESSRLIRVGIIILIIIAALVGLAFISMGIAKFMGRSPLDGLLGFFILCALCCCRNR